MLFSVSKPPGLTAKPPARPRRRAVDRTRLAWILVALSDPVLPGGQGMGRGRHLLHRLIGLILLVFAPAVLAQTSSAPLAPQPPLILILGDSLSAEYGLKRGSGWVALLEERLRKEGRREQIHNASISGETTAGGRTRLPTLLAKYQPRIVVIELGGNDALRGLSLAGTEANLREMIRASRATGARVLVLGMQMPPNYGAAYASAFEAVFERAAQLEQASLVPMFLEGFADRMDLFQADRIHPNEKAQPLMLNTVWPSLRRIL